MDGWMDGWMDGSMDDARTMMIYPLHEMSPINLLPFGPFFSFLTVKPIAQEAIYVEFWQNPPCLWSKAGRTRCLFLSDRPYRPSHRYRPTPATPSTRSAREKRTAKSARLLYIICLSNGLSFAARLGRATGPPLFSGPEVRSCRCRLPPKGR